MVKKKSARGSKKSVRETRAAYQVGNAQSPEDEGLYIPLMVSRLSGKNQITLPVRMTRILDWRPGDRISLMVHEDRIMLSRLPRDDESWSDFVRVNNPEWNSKEAIEAWVRREHESWDREWDPD